MKRIILVGMPAAGKSYWGKILSDKFGLFFIDLDDYIEDDACMNIQTIFEKEGEEGFRLRESNALRFICKDYTDFVLATGGGTPCFNSNMDIILKEGISIYLKTPAQLLMHRIENQLKSRPLIEQLDRDHLKSYLQETADLRANFYSRAEHILDVEDQSLATFEEIINSL